MIKVLDKTKTLTTLVADTSNGLGQLKVMNDVLTEELNGIYELEFDILTTENHYQDLKDNMLVKVNINEMDDEQIFRVYFISEPINFVSHVKCQHITYDLSKIVVKPFTATGAVAIKNGLVTYMLGTYPFTTWTDITNTTSTFTNSIPRAFRECLGGYEGSVLDVLRPEYEWDNLTVKLHAHRGSDHDTRISYGKNLTDFQQEENNENVYDAVYGFAVVDDVTYEATSIYNKTGATYPKVLNVDFSSMYESGDVPTGAELLSYATTYATNNDIEVPSVNIKVSFVPLWQTEEYKNIAPLERVFLGDTVHVFFDKLGVEASSRVIKTVWSPSLKRYTEIELGDARANLNTVINDTVNQAVENLDIDVEADVGYLEEQLNELSSLIINGLGLYKTEEQVQGGGVRIILHNKPTLAASDTQYYMSAAGIMVSTDYGVTWTAGFDAQTGELFTQALSTITLKALEIYGSYIEGSQMLFGDPNDKYIMVQAFDFDGDDDPDGISFDGSGYVRFQPQEEFIVNNVNSGGDVLNSLVLDATTDNYIWLNNYRGTSGVLANQMYMRYSPTYDSSSVQLDNYKQDNTPSPGNRFRMSASSTLSQMYMYNYKYDEYNFANEVTLSSSSNGNNINIVNYEPLNGGATQANCLKFSSATGKTMLWSTSDLQIRSSGAVRVYADLYETSVIGDYNNNRYGSNQDLYLGGYSVKIQAAPQGRIYLYWGGSRYYLGVLNGTVTATPA